MPPKLHQILALEKGVKGSTEGTITRTYHDAQKQALFQGLTRVYKPNDTDDRDLLPSETKIVQLTAADVLDRAVKAWVRQADVVATKDRTNQDAQANVVVDGEALLFDVPVTTLLYLDRVLDKVRELITKLPVLDPEVDWGNNPDPATGLWKSRPEQTVRTKKVPKAFVRAPATDKFPAQVDTFTEDVIVGTWERVLFSGALPAPRKAELLTRVQNLQESIKLAREEANTIEVVPQYVGQILFDHLVGP
jgi:hypothetical protein